MNYFQDIGAIKKLKCIFLKKVIVNEIMHLTLITHKCGGLQTHPASVLETQPTRYATAISSLLPDLIPQGASFYVAATRTTKAHIMEACGIEPPSPLSDPPLTMY